MADKKYLSLDGLGLYDEKIKAKIVADDATTLASAKSYADGLATNYDAAGAATTAESNAKSYTDTEVAKANSAAAAAKTQADKGVADAATAQAAAEAAQADVDSLEAYVGTFTASEGVDTVVKYIDAKTANIASDETVTALGDRVTQAEKDIDALEADHLVKADKTELEAKITDAQSAADAAQGYAEGVAAGLTTEVTDRTDADTALGNRITTLEGQITGLTGAMHFEGVEDEVPADVSSYEAGDVIIVGEKEYVFNGTAFVEFGDVSAEGERIGALETKMSAAEGNITQAQTDIATNATAIAAKAEQTALDAEVTARTDADTALSGRIKTLEDAIGESGSVAGDIATAKSEAISAAAADATDKADKALADAKIYADGLDEAMSARVDALDTKAHTHANKDLLDTYTQTEANLADAVAKKHSHGNLDTLEGITAIKVAAWDAAEANAKSYADNLNTDLETKVTANADAIAAFKAISDEEIASLFA